MVVPGFRPQTVSDVRKTFEALSAPAVTVGLRPPRPKDKNKCISCATIYFKTRFGAMPLAVLFGIFIYYYVTFLILSPTMPVKYEAPKVNE